MVKIACSFFLCALLSACTLTPPKSGDLPRLAGKVALHGQGVDSVEILAWPATAPSLGSKAPYSSPPSTAGGSFSLSLPAGDYYLLARSDKLFSYYGRNPLTIPQEGIANLKIALVPLPAPLPQRDVSITEGVSGVIVSDGLPLAGAVVYAYTDLTGSLKGMGYATSAPSDETGRYELSLPAGTYYLLARLRQGGGMAMGPLRAGDYNGYAPENPVRVTSNSVSLVAIPTLEVPEKIELFSTSLFGQTSLRGRILDKAGKPVAGLRAVLYSDAVMFNRPDFVSQPSDKNGNFVLSFPNGGTYYLAARQQLGGAPAPGELYGTYDSTPDHSLRIKTGEQLESVVVIVEEMW